MKEYVHNYNNLKEENIHETIIRTKAFNISKNDKNQAITPDMIRVIEEYLKKEGMK